MAGTHAYGNGATLLFFKVGATEGRTDGQSRINHKF